MQTVANKTGAFYRQELRGLQAPIEIFFCLCLAVLLLWKGIIPGWQSLHTDFPNYYLVARLLREGYSLDRIYDWIWLQRVKDHWGIDQPLVGFAGLTPFSALPILPLSFFAALTAKRLWIAVNLLILVASVEGLHRVTTLGRARVWLLCLLCVFPLRTSFLLGQMHLLVLVLLVVAYVFHQKKNQAACALCLSIAGMLKIYPFLFGLYFLWKKQWATAAAMLLTAVALLAASAVIFGPGVTQTYLLQVLPRSLTGEVLDPYSAQSGSMAALFHRAFLYEPQLNPMPLRNSPALYAFLYPAWQVVVLTSVLGMLALQKADRDGEQVEWATWVFTLLLLSPVPASYHFVVMTFSMVLLADCLFRQRRYRTITVALTLYGLISAVELLPRRITQSNEIFLGFARLWLAIGFWLVLLFCLWRNREKGLGFPRLQPRAVLLCFIAAGLWSAGVAGYHAHFLRLRQEIQRRLPDAPRAYLSTGFHNTERGNVFTAMGENKYQVLDQDGRGISQPESDELSVATTLGAPDLVVEVADRGSSRLMVVPLTTDLTLRAPRARLMIQDAESPAVSPDGRTVVFIRETRGRGALWLLRLEAPLGSPRTAPVPLTGDAYDVRSFALAPSGWIVFAAGSAAHTSLFQLTPGGVPKKYLPVVEDAEAPTISGDERLVAFTTSVHHRRQLAYDDRKTGRRQVLTAGDCNAYSPQWTSAMRLTYASDCGRGFGLTALASIVVQSPPAPAGR